MTDPDAPAADAVRLRLLDHVVDVLAPSAATAATLRAAWSRCLSTDPVTGPALTLPVSTLPLSDALTERLVSELILAAITTSAPQTVLLHAAALAAPDGGVLGLVAASGTGKTTAARTLARALAPDREALGYVTDECLAVGPATTVRALPKPLSVVSGAGEAKRMRGPDDLGLSPCPPGPLRLRRLVLLRRDPGWAAAPQLIPVDPVDGLAALVAQSSGALTRPGTVAALAALAAATGGVLALDYAEIEDAALLLADLLGPGADPPPAVAALGPLPQAAADLDPPVIDGLAGPDGALLLRADATIRLGGPTARVWLATLRGDRAALDDLALDWGEATVGAHLDGLRRQGLLGR